MNSSFSTDRVVVAMSGGVDSAVAAMRLVHLGYEVIGVTLHLLDYPDDGSVRGRCCAPEDQYDARRTADYLGIAHYSFDRRKEFLQRVVEPFVNSYLSGQTPSPCVICNRTIKIQELFSIADRLGARWLATGHYARVVRDTLAARSWLYQALDVEKDQSYFLHTLGSSELERCIFPLGESTKTEVRHEAKKYNLPGAMKGESQELCFIPTGNYKKFVEDRAGQDNRIRPGPILNAKGKEIGRHKGIHGFTIGQRKGLGVILGEPSFVTRLNAETATVHIGATQDLMCHGLMVRNTVFAETLPHDFSALIKVRARHEGVLGKIIRTSPGCAAVHFDQPVRSVAVGQIMVAYENRRVLGGGQIVRVISALLNHKYILKRTQHVPNPATRIAYIKYSCLLSK